MIRLTERGYSHRNSYTYKEMNIPEIFVPVAFSFLLNNKFISFY